MQHLVPDNRKRAVLLLCCLAQFMVILDVSVVNVALPSIRHDLGFSAVDLQWVVNAYTLTFAGFLLLGGRAADLRGSRPVFIAGMLLFALASLAGALASSQEQLIIARGAQGLGGAVVAPVTLSILTNTFREGSERNRALAAWGAMGGAGGAAGVLLGGILTDLFGWPSILLINVPIGIALAVAARRLVPPPGRAQRTRGHYDAAGAVVVTAALTGLTFAIVRTNVNGWGSPATLGMLGASLVLLGLFVLIEGRLARRPLVPLRIFASRRLSVANLVAFFLGSAVFAMWYFLSLYLQLVQGYSPIRAGLAFLPMTLSIMVGSVTAGRLAGRFGTGPVLALGMGMIAVGMTWLSGVQAGGSYAVDVLLPAILLAVGIGFAFVTVTISAVSGVERDDSGLASGLVNTARQFGGSLGLAILATVATSATGHPGPGREAAARALTAGYHDAFLVGAGLAAAGALTALLAFVKRPARRPGVACPAPAARPQA
jgi:EmrB/QacA subfamily drug resistance transporter